MKRLYILRHSKAGQTNKKLLDDHERKLTQKGVDLCREVGAYLKEKNPLPDAVFSSTAVRANETAELVCQNAGIAVTIELIPRLYLATPEDIYSVIHAADDGIDSLLVVGHNPGLHIFSMDVAGSGDKKLYREMKNHFPPPSLVTFDLNIQSWGLLESQCGELVDFRYAKQFK